MSITLGNKTSMFHLTGASPTTYFVGNMVWQNVVNEGKKILIRQSKGDTFTIQNDGQYDQVHQLAFATPFEQKKVLETASYEDLHKRDNYGNTPLIWAAAQGNQQLVKLFVEQGAAVNMQNFAGETALYLASSFGLEKTCLFLLENGADWRLSTLEESSPLHAASAGGHLSVIKMLVSHGSFLNATDEEGDTPLHYAVREGKREAVHLLVQLGAQLLKNEDQESPLDLAVELEEKWMIDHLSTQLPSRVDSEHGFYF